RSGAEPATAGRLHLCSGSLGRRGRELRQRVEGDYPSLPALSAIVESTQLAGDREELSATLPLESTGCGSTAREGHERERKRNHSCKEVGNTLHLPSPPIRCRRMRKR